MAPAQPISLYINGVEYRLRNWNNHIQLNQLQVLSIWSISLECDACPTPCLVKSFDRKFYEKFEDLPAHII
jgi:hypothetical protein